MEKLKVLESAFADGADKVISAVEKERMPTRNLIERDALDIPPKRICRVPSQCLDLSNGEKPSN